MEKHYIHIGERRCRVEINMNTTELWEKLSGKMLGQFEMESSAAQKNGAINTRDMLLWLFCGIIEGEEMDERKYSDDFTTFKRSVPPSILSVFVPMFLVMYVGNALEEQKTEIKKKRMKSFVQFLFFGNWRYLIWPILLWSLVYAGWRIFGTH